MWLEKVYRKRLITSALRKDLLQIDGLYARISKLRYELYDLKKRTVSNYVALVWPARARSKCPLSALMVVRIKRVRFYSRKCEVFSKRQGKLSIIINKVSVLSGCA